MPKSSGVNTKKEAGNARKAAVKAEKQAAEDAKRAAQEDAEWAKGSKSNAKKEADAARKADTARKKAERDALLAAEEANAPSKPKANPKAGAKKNAAAAAPAVRRPLNLDALDDAEAGGQTATPALNASGIDDALDALALSNDATAAGDKVERHPERRFRAAFAAFEARRMPEVESENPGLRRQQRVDLIRKEFEKSPENPFNQVSVQYNATKDAVREVKMQEREKTERRLGDKS